MPGSPLVRAAVAGAVVAVLLAVAAVGSGSGFALAKHARARPIAPDLPAFANYLVLALIVTIIVLEIAVLRLTLSEAGALPKRKRFRALRTVVTFAAISLLLVFMPQRLRDWLAHHSQAPKHPTAAQQQKPSGKNLRAPARSRGLGLVVTGGIALALLATLGGIAWFKVGTRPTGRGRDRLAAQLAAELDAGIAALDDIADPRLAVLACYDRMQRAIDVSGLPRRASDTPRETVLRVLEERKVAGPSARRLADLFERARFSPHDVDQRMRSEAIACLRDVRDQLMADPEPEPEPEPEAVVV
jgi:hypothetical protein